MKLNLEKRVVKIRNHKIKVSKVRKQKKQIAIEEISTREFIRGMKKKKFIQISLIDVAEIREEVIYLDILKIIEEYKDVFTEILRLVPYRKKLNHKINTVPDAIPQVRRERRLSKLKKEKMQKRISELLKAGHI